MVKPASKETVVTQVGVDAADIVRLFPRGVVFSPAEDGEGFFLITEYSTTETTRIARVGTVEEAVAMAACINGMVNRLRNDATPLRPEHLLQLAFSPPASEGALGYWSRLLPPVRKGSITEITVAKYEEGEEWELAILQGYPDAPNGRDDHVAVTSKLVRSVGDITRLLAALLPTGSGISCL